MKFEIFQSESNQKYYFRLKAKNGQIILSSKGYASKEDLLSDIGKLRTQAADPANFETKQAKNGKFHFIVNAEDNATLGNSQLYKAKTTMQNGIKSVGRVAPEARIVDLTA